MKRILPVIGYAICSFAFLFPCSLKGQSVANDTLYWEGNLQINGTSLPLTLREVCLSDTTLLWMGSPAQTQEWFPVTKQRRTRDSLLFTIKSMNIVYRGGFNTAKDSLSGSFKQGIYNGTVLFTRQQHAYRLLRPQTPSTEQLPYETQETVFKSTTDYSFGGTLTIPNVSGSVPAVILLSGSGLQDRDETISGHKPFAVLADFLTRKGFAVLRYDDRGWGTTDSLLLSGTTFDFADDALAAYRVLVDHHKINADQIALLGHSEGGLVAAIAAAKEPKIAALVLMAAPGITGEEILASQTKAILESHGDLTEDLIKKTVKNNQSLYKILKQNTPRTQKMAQLEKQLHKQWKDYTAGEPQANPENEQAFVANLMTTLSQPWFECFLTINPAQYLKKLHQPILILNGDKDLQVLSSLNTSAIESALKKGGNTKYTVKRYPHLNHLFQKCSTCRIDEYAILEETINPAVLNDIAAFLQHTFSH